MSVRPEDPEPPKAPKETDTAPSGERPLPPEEGIQGWLNLVGSSLCLFCSFGFLNAIGVFQTTYQQTLLRDYSASDISWIFAIQLFFMWSPGPFFGRVIDTFGPGPILYPCSVLCVLGLCMTSLAHEYYQIFLAQGICFGVGAGGVFTSGLVTVGQWFVKRRGLASGIATSGSSLGGVIFPIFLNRLVEQLGLFAALRYTALLIGILLAVACLLVRRRLPPKKWAREAAWVDLRLFKDTKFALYCLGSYMVMWGLWAPFDYVSSMALDRAGFSSTLALYLISIINATSIPGRIIPPYLSDKLGHFNVLSSCSLGTGATILCLWLPFNYHPSHAGLIVFAAVYGFFSGAVVSLLMPCVAKIGDLSTLGVRFGTFQIIMSIACLTGLPIMGAILRRQDNKDYSGLILFGAVACLLGGSLLTGSTYMLGKARGSSKV